MLRVHLSSVSNKKSVTEFLYYLMRTFMHWYSQVHSLHTYTSSFLVHKMVTIKFDIHKYITHKRLGLQINAVIMSPRSSLLYKRTNPSSSSNCATSFSLGSSWEVGNLTDDKSLEGRMWLSILHVRSKRLCLSQRSRRFAGMNETFHKQHCLHHHHLTIHSTGSPNLGRNHRYCAAVESSP